MAVNDRMRCLPMRCLSTMRAIVALIALGAAPCAIAQSGGGSQSPSSAPDRTLEIAPRFNPSAPALPESTPTPNSSSDTGGNDIEDQADKPPSDDSAARPPPNLVVGAQIIVSNSQPCST